MVVARLLPMMAVAHLLWTARVVMILLQRIWRSVLRIGLIGAMGKI